MLLPTKGFGQIPGNIDWPARPGGVGARVLVDATRGLNADSGESWFVGGRASLSLPKAAVWIGGGYAGLAAAGDNVATGGGGFAFALSSSGVTTLAIDGGVGLTRQGGQWIWGAPVGFTLWIDPPATSALRPFVRAHGIMVGTGSDTDIGFSGMGGVEIRIPSGPGLHIGLQWEHLDVSDAVVVGGGVSFGF